MKLGDIVVVCATAVVTVVFSLALLVPRNVGAVDVTVQVTPRIAVPTFTTQGCEFRLTTDRPTYEAGEKPTFKVVATNPTGDPVEAAVWLRVSASAPASPMSRVMPIPRTIWSHKCLVRLAPGQTRELEIPCDAALEVLQQISVTMSDQAEEILSRQLPVQQGVSPLVLSPLGAAAAEPKR